MPTTAPSVENDLCSSSVETLLVFEHLFDTCICGVSRCVAGRIGGVGVPVAKAAAAIETRPSPSPPQIRTITFVETV